MIKLKPALCALTLSLSCSSAFAAPASWGASDDMASIEASIDAKDYPAAISELKEHVADNPKDADAYNLLGYSHRKLKAYDEAETYYEKALSLDPKHKGAMEYLGELYIETDRMDDARAMLERLDEACFFSCEEYDTLKERIETQQAGW